jgi:hypothetical protein
MGAHRTADYRRRYVCSQNYYENPPSNTKAHCRDRDHCGHPQIAVPQYALFMAQYRGFKDILHNDTSLALGRIRTEHNVDICDCSQNMVSRTLIDDERPRLMQARLSTRYIQSSRLFHVTQVIVESSMITWIATFIYAVITTRLPSSLRVCLLLIFILHSSFSPTFRTRRWVLIQP